MPFKTRAIRFVQNGRVFFSAAIPASELIGLTKVDVWKEDKPDENKGYQRAPSTSRKREIAHYVEKPDAIMPIGGLANSRSKAEGGSYGKMLEFEPDPGQSEKEAICSGSLTIPKGALPLFVVDMQHRLGGFEYAITEENAQELSTFPLPITIADGLSLLEEVDQFDLINTTQKKVRTDLARRLHVIQAKEPGRRLALDARGALWEARGPIVASILNKTEGVWKGRIVAPNAQKREFPGAVVKETSFVTSLKPILQTPYFSRLQEEHAAELIRRFWEAVARVCPKAASTPENYLLLKTPGIFSLHSIAPEVFELARDKGGEITAEVLHTILRHLKEGFGDDFWDKEYKEDEDTAALYGSMKGFKILASKLRQALPDLNLTMPKKA
jgi:DGQHR domain-containing protein